MLVDARGRRITRPKPNQRVIRSRKPQWLGSRGEPPRPNHTGRAPEGAWDDVLANLNRHRR